MANKTGRNEQLQVLAARIADDQSVDWASQMDPALAGDPAALGLRELEQIAQGFRHVQLAGQSAAPGACRFTFGPLRVLERLGEGAQGEVWRAYDPMLDMQVALKLRRLDSDTLGHEFLAEARRLARVRHANIVSVYGAAVEDGRAGLWMELVRGTTLAELLARDGRFPPEEVREIGLDLCRTVAAVHRHGLLHGDIKPENVMREVSGRIVLMDFGVARELDAEPTLTVSGSMKYLAPEVLQGGEPSVASDIYSTGAVLFRLLTGEYPDMPALRAARQDAGRLRGQAHLLRAIERALEPEPSKRFATAADFARALSPALQHAVPWRALALAAALALAVGGAVWLWQARRAASAVAWQAQASFQLLDEQGGQALADGSAIALGDRLVLEFRSNRPAYVYVFDDDGSGDVAVLFPLAGLRPANPLAAGVTYRLPGQTDGNQLSWQVSREAKRDVFVVLAADAPRPAVEDRIRRWSHARQLDQGATRGALEVVASPLERDIDNPELRAILRDLQAAESGGHVRHWRFSLPHHGS
jgi:serine/threonine protein kinase